MIKGFYHQQYLCARACMRMYIHILCFFLSLSLSLSLSYISGTQRDGHARRSKRREDLQKPTTQRSCARSARAPDAISTRGLCPLSWLTFNLLRPLHGTTLAKSPAPLRRVAESWSLHGILKHSAVDSSYDSGEAHVENCPDDYPKHQHNEDVGFVHREF